MGMSSSTGQFNDSSELMQQQLGDAFLDVRKVAEVIEKVIAVADGNIPSAYLLAVAQGYTGDQAQWVADLISNATSVEANKVLVEQYKDQVASDKDAVHTDKLSSDANAATALDYGTRAIQAQAAIVAAIASGSLDNASLNAVNRDVLSALDRTSGLPAILVEAGYVGTFKFDTTNISANVVNGIAFGDTNRGIYILPADDLTGASGAWVRQFSGAPELGWLADRSGVQDVAAAVLTAIKLATPFTIFAEPTKEIVISGGKFRIATPIVLPNGERVRFRGTNSATVVIDLGQNAGNAISGTPKSFELDGVKFVGSDNQPVNALTNTRVMLIGNGDPTLVERVSVRNCTFKNLIAVGSLNLADNLLVTHAIYLNGVDTAIIEGNKGDSISGAFVFLKNINHLRQRYNHWKGGAWYHVQINNGVYDWVIDGDIFDCSNPNGVYKGGAINSVSDYGLTQNRGGKVINCWVWGYFSYGGTFRSQSDLGITFENNTIGICRLGTANAGAGDQLTAIRISSRGLVRENNVGQAVNPTSSDPQQAIIVRGNKALLGFEQDTFVPSARVFIYISNDWEVATDAPWYGVQTRKPIKSIIVENNTCFSPSATSYFTHGLIIHGNVGGIEDVRIFNNYFELYLNSSSPVAGGICIAASNNTTGLVDRLQMGGNVVSNFTNPTISQQTAYVINPNINNVQITAANTAVNCFYPFRTISGSGPNLELCDNVRAINCVNAPLFSQPLTKYFSPAVFTQAVNAYTAALTDANSYIRFTNAGATTFTVPPNNAVAFPIGTVIEFGQSGTGTVTVAAGAGVTINSRGGALSTAAQHSVAALKKTQIDTWTLVGDLQ